MDSQQEATRTRSAQQFADRLATLARLSLAGVFDRYKVAGASTVSHTQVQFDDPDEARAAAESVGFDEYRSTGDDPDNLLHHWSGQYHGARVEFYATGRLSRPVQVEDATAALVAITEAVAS